MAKHLLIPLLFVIFAYSAAAQGIQEPVEGLPDTVAVIYVIQHKNTQTVRCVTTYDLDEVRMIVMEFFNNVLYFNTLQEEDAIWRGSGSGNGKVRIKNM